MDTAQLQATHAMKVGYNTSLMQKMEAEHDALLRFNRYGAAAEPRLAAALHATAQVLTQLEMYDEALKKLKQAFDIFRRVHGGAPHSDVAKVLSNMGICFWRQGNNYQALRNMEKAANIFLYSSGRNSLERAAALGNIANVVYGQGKIDEALSGWQEALQIKKARLPGDPLLLADVAGSASNIARVQQQQGDLKGALESFKEALFWGRSLRGELDVETGRLFVKVGTIRCCLEQYDEALPDLYNALWILNRAPESSSELADVCFLIGSAHEARGRAKAAKELYLLSGNSYAKALGPQSWQAHEAFRRGGFPIDAEEGELYETLMDV